MSTDVAELMRTVAHIDEQQMKRLTCANTKA